MNLWSSWKVLRHEIGMLIVQQTFVCLNEFISFAGHKALSLRGNCCIQCREKLDRWPSPAFQYFRHTGQEVWNGFPSKQQSHWFSLLADTEGLKTTNSSFCIGSIPFHEEFLDSTFILMCNLKVSNFCFSPLKSLSASLTSNYFCDPVTCRFTLWIHSFMPLFS
jgi:hypothetical protein